MVRSTIKGLSIGTVNNGPNLTSIASNAAYDILHSSVSHFSNFSEISDVSGHPFLHFSRDLYQ